ncbi:MAG: phosphoenolpyruvate--protein phosphotransferase [Lachnospiraceae bacterium]|nr:phosphoenolpyruvate--protein phosphotransferase [Lachnospiraceae bacterium]
MYQGTKASAGIGIGRAVVLKEREDVFYRRSERKEEEQVRLAGAFAEAVRVTEEMAEEMAGRVSEKETGILEAQAVLLQDPAMKDAMEREVEGGAGADEAIRKVCGDFGDLFAAMEDERMRQRAADLADIRERLLDALTGRKAVDLSALAPGSILIARELTPSMTAGLSPERTAGIGTELGGRTSHTAILARAMGIPAVVGAAGLCAGIRDGDTVILDGTEGLVHVNPPEEKLAAYRKKIEEETARREGLRRYRKKETRTADGRKVLVAANIGRAEEAGPAGEWGAEGIGLFRTEFLFMGRTRMPEEEEQYEAYRSALEAFPDHEVIVRTLDIGGDKEIPFLGLVKEENPFLGYRAVRLYEGRPELLRVQFRALLRAGVYGRLKIMIPMVISLEELRECRRLLRETEAELSREGVLHAKEIPLGIMVETAAAVCLADVLAKEADFFSIGTNDLTQYMLAVDRGNEQVAGLYSPFHPAVLRSIRRVILCGKEAGIPVGMCGEAASDPRLIPLLISFGLDEFSTAASLIPETRKRISELSKKETDTLAERAMDAKTREETERIVSDFARRQGENV